MDLPEAYLSRFKKFFPDEWEPYAAGLDQPPFRGVRANTLKIAPDKLTALLSERVELAPVPFCPTGYYIPAAAEGLGNHPLHLAGGFYMQEPSAMSAVEALSPQPGERILDLCAAPGGKSSQIAAALMGKGVLVANEFVESRARILSSNLERMGAANALVTSMRPDALCALLPGWFDRVLVDAPCSGEGMLRREPAALENWSPENVAACAVRQGKILDSAAQAVRPGGWLCYSTCTFAPEENEETAAAFLTRHPDFTLEPIEAHDLGQPGRAALAPDCPDIGKARRIFPRMGGEGHFVALFRRREEAQVSHSEPVDASRRRPGKNRPARPHPPGISGKEAAALLEDFWKRSLQGAPPGRLELRSDKLYLPPADCPPLEGLRLLRVGLLAGEVIKNRFVPAHALFASPAVRPQRELDLLPEDPLLAAYLRGEEIAACLADGYVGVRVCGLPLGFGKVSAGRLKNHYPKGLRLR